MPGPTRPCAGLRDVSKSFFNGTSRRVRALDGVSLDLRPSEFVALLGPTGCGKTTLLNLLAGIETPTAGRVILADGIRPGDGLACVFQHYTLFPWHNILSNVAFGLRVRGVERRERHRRAQAWLDRVGLADFAKRRPHELSGGMRQRAALVQALITAPRLLLMDEPFGALDLETRTELQRLLAALWRSAGPTVLFVTHNLDEAVLLADRIIALSPRPGRVRADLPVALPRPREPGGDDFLEMHLTVRRALGGPTDVTDI
jgi:NitT/TauT family transport system ATP-binding protein